MKLGLLVEAEEGLTWERWRVILQAAERLEFDSVWISDHLQSPWSSEPSRGLDAWIALTFAATHTRRLRIGSLVSPATLRPPVVLARMAAAVETLAPGRLTVGLGLGWNAAEHAAAHLPFPPLVDRAALLTRTAAALRERTSAPLLIGGSGATALQLAAEHADAWNITTASVDVFRECTARLDQLCRQRGREPKNIIRSVAAGFLVGHGEMELRERARRMQELVPPLAHVALDDVPEAARQRGWIVGTPGEFVRELDSLARAGVELAILGHYDQDDVDALELLADRVMPAFG